MMKYLKKTAFFLVTIIFEECALFILSVDEKVLCVRRGRVQTGIGQVPRQGRRGFNQNTSG